jgi:WD40 repeat protein
MADIPLNVGLVRSMKAHPILPTVVAIGGEEGVVVADAATGSVKPIGRPGLRALAVEWTADGASVLAGGRGLERIPLDPGGPAWSARGHGGAVWGLARLDADRVVSAGSDGVVRLWSIGTGTELGQLPLASEKLWSIDVRNGELGVSSQSGAFTIRANEVDRWFGVHAPPVLDVRGSIRVERVADRAIRVAHGDSTRIVETDTPILLAAMTADASAVVLALDDGSVRCMELDGPRERWVLLGLGDGIHEQERHGMRSLSIDDAGRHVLLGRRTAGASLHAMETGLTLWTIKPSWHLESASLAPDGTFACITGREGHVQRVECAGGSVEQVCKPFTQSIPASTISGDGSRLIVGSLDGAVVLFEADSMRELLRVGCSPSPIDRVWIEEDGIHSIDRDRWHRVR